MNGAIDRRRVLLGLAAAGSWAGASATGLLPDRASATTPVAARAFASSFEAHRATLGPVAVGFDRPLPAGLAGTLYRNGPARMARGATRQAHWFDGDGMVQALRIAGGTLEHRGAMVRTQRSLAEERAGRYLWGGFATHLQEALSVQSPDDLNVGNISVLPIGEELLALWEAGSPWRVDPQSLETLGRKVFSPQTDRLAFSAHPRRDPDGRIWNFGYTSGSGKLALYDIAPDGRLNRAQTINAPNADMVHDFVITERFLVFILMPLLLAPDTNGPLMSRLRWHDHSPAIALVVDKRSLAEHRCFEIEPFFAFHFGNAWEDGDTIRIEALRTLPFDVLMRQIVDATAGRAVTPVPDTPFAADVVLDLARGEASLEDLPLSGSDFPSFDPRLSGRRSSRLITLCRSARAAEGSFGFNAVRLFDRQAGTVVAHDYGPGVLAEEHLFVPRLDARRERGWIVGTWYDWQVQRSGLSVFDSAHLADGPIATARLPYRLPLGLHGQFVGTSG